MNLSDPWTDVHQPPLIGNRGCPKSNMQSKCGLDESLPGKCMNTGQNIRASGRKIRTTWHICALVAYQPEQLAAPFARRQNRQLQNFWTSINLAEAKRGQKQQMSWKGPNRILQNSSTLVSSVMAKMWSKRTYSLSGLKLHAVEYSTLTNSAVARMGSETVHSQNDLYLNSTVLVSLEKFCNCSDEVINVFLLVNPTCFGDFRNYQT